MGNTSWVSRQVRFLVPKLDDAIYIKCTLQIHHLERVGKPKGNFYYKPTYKKSSNLLRAVDYALASTPDSDSEELDKPSDNEKDEPFTEAVDQHDILEVTIGNIVVVLYELRKKQLKYLGVVQNIAGDCVSVQFLKRSGKKTFSVRDGDFNDCSCCHIKAVIRGAVHYEYSWAVFNWRKVFTKELIHVTVLFVAFICCLLYTFQKLLSVKMCIIQKQVVFSFQINGHDKNFYEQCSNRIFIFDYSCQAFSTLKLNERHNNVFLFILSSGNLLSI